MEFEQWFREKSRKFEKLLFRTVVFFLFLLLAGQALQTAPAVRRTLNLVDRLEGIPYLSPETDAPALADSGRTQDGQYLVLKVIDMPENGMLQVLVNGHAVADFHHTSTVTVAVQDGDMIEVDGDASSGEIQVVVSAASRGVISPVGGKSIFYYGVPETVGWVIIDE